MHVPFFTEGSLSSRAEHGAIAVALPGQTRFVRMGLSQTIGMIGQRGSAHLHIHVGGSLNDWPGTISACTALRDARRSYFPNQMTVVMHQRMGLGGFPFAPWTLPPVQYATDALLEASVIDGSSVDISGHSHGAQVAIAAAVGLDDRAAQERVGLYVIGPGQMYPRQQALKLQWHSGSVFVLRGEFDPIPWMAAGVETPFLEDEMAHHFDGSSAPLVVNPGYREVLVRGASHPTSDYARAFAEVNASHRLGRKFSNLRQGARSHEMTWSQAPPGLAKPPAP